MGKINPDPDVLTRHARHMLTTRWGEQNRTRGVYLAQQIRAVERGAGHLTPTERTRLHAALAATAPTPAPQPEKKNTP